MKDASVFALYIISDHSCRCPENQIKHKISVSVGPSGNECVLIRSNQNSPTSSLLFR